MKNKLLLYLLLPVAIIAVAYFGYDYLSKNVDSGRLPTETTKQVTQQNDSEETKDNNNENEKKDETQKVEMPDFLIQDHSGEEVKFSDFVGKPIVMNFWASWCGPCKSEMPDFQKVYEEMGSEIQFLMVNVTDGQRETKQSANQYISENGFTFPVYYDEGLTASFSLGVYGYPTTFFIDSEGFAVAAASGALEEEMLRQGIELIYDDED